jgi:D-cysteine desulfhydrase
MGLIDLHVDQGDVHLDGTALGGDYAEPTSEGDAALVWAARHCGWVLDRVYTAKTFAALLAMADEGRWGDGDGAPPGISGRSVRPG